MSLIDAMLLESYRDPREVWIAPRTDGIRGSGTSDDPYDGSTTKGPEILITNLTGSELNYREAVVITSASLDLDDGDVVTISGVTVELPDDPDDAQYWNGSFPVYGVSGNTFKYWMKRKGLANAPGNIGRAVLGTASKAAKLTFCFDEVMRELGERPNTFMRIHLGPGTLETRGYCDGALHPFWEPKRGMHIRGSGMDVTVLKLVYADREGGNYAAIGGNRYGNLADYAEVSDLTVDCNLPGQPITPPLGSWNFDYAAVACAAVQLSGSFVAIRRVKAINWGTQYLTTETFVLGAGGTHQDYGTEAVGAVIEDCICVQPNEDNAYASTVIHATSGAGPGSLRGAALRRNFVDSAFQDGKSNAINEGWLYSTLGSTELFVIRTVNAHDRSVRDRFRIDIRDGQWAWSGYFEVFQVDSPTLVRVKLLKTHSGAMPAGLSPWPEAPGPPWPNPPGPPWQAGLVYWIAVLRSGWQHALSTAATVASVVEDNVVLNSSVGGPYQDTGGTREIIVRRNYYSNVDSGPALVNGNLTPGPRSVSLTQSQPQSLTAIATLPDHGFGAVDDTILLAILLATPTANNGALTPSAYNRVILVTILDKDRFRYPMLSDPEGDATALAEKRADGLDTLEHLQGGVAQGTTVADDHLLRDGDRIKVSHATPEEFQGFFQITVPTANTFRYQMNAVPSQSLAQNATFQRVLAVDRLIVEDNVIELRRHGSPYGVPYGTPEGIKLDDNNLIQAGPPYTHGEVVIRNNVVRVVDGNELSQAAWGIFVYGAKAALISDNVVDVPSSSPLRDARCGQVRYFNSRTAAGALIQGADGVTLAKRTELEVEIEDAMLLSI